MHMKFSVGVMIPVYNMGEYLERCVRSVLDNGNVVGQIVIVDDGSTDGSAETCDEIAKTDDRLKVVHIDHSGLVAARNASLDHFDTEYISFVDADDWIDKDFFANAVSVLRENKDVDIFVNGMVRDDNKGNVRGMFKEHSGDYIFEHEAALIELFKGDCFRWELCGKVYRSKLFEGWRADESIFRGEDLDRDWILFNKANMVAYNGESKYHYYFNSESMVNSSEIMLCSMYTVYKRIIQSEYYISEALRLYLINYIFRELVFQIKRLCCWDVVKNKDEIKEYQAELGKLDSLEVSQSGDIEVFGYPKMKITLNEAKAKYGDYDHLLNTYRYINEVIDDELTKVKSNYSNVNFYGTGKVAEFVSRLAEHRGLTWDGYIVSDGSMIRNSFHGKKVRRISDISPSEEILIVLAVSEENQDVVIKGVMERGLDKPISLIDNFREDFKISDWI